jgi:spore germination cell wall hydrolase CwlJ-like protein
MTGTFFSAVPTKTDWRVARFALQGWDIVPKALYFFNPSLYAGGWMNGLTACVGYGQMLFCAGPS